MNLIALPEIKDFNNETRYWAVSNDSQIFPVHSFFVDIKNASSETDLKVIQEKFIKEGLRLKEIGVNNARLMSEFIDVTIPVEKLTGNKLDAFYISVIRSEFPKKKKDESSRKKNTAKVSKLKIYLKHLLSR